MINLFSPPNGGYPQEVPDYWRFADGTVRKDLQSLSPEALNNLGWTGPIHIPVAKQVDDEGNVTNEDEYDYDGETHKSIWYEKERKFVIIPKEESELPYLSNLFVPPKPDAKWGEFKRLSMASPELNSLLGEVLKVAPIVATTFPAAFFQLENGKYEDFILVWNSILTLVEVSPEFIRGVKTLATSCNLPQEFIAIFSAT